VDELRLREAARRSLRELGPQSAGELHRRLDPELLTLDGETLEVQDLERLLLRELADEEAFAAFPLADGRLCDLDDVLEGLTLTHRVDDEERATGAVTFEPDLAALHLCSPDGRTVPLVDGGALEIVGIQPWQLSGPEGWLPTEAVLVVRVSGGRVELAGRDDAPPVDHQVAERLDRTLTTLRELEPFGVDEVQLVYETRVRYPQLFGAPTAPLGDLLSVMGTRSTDHGLLRSDEEDPEEHDGSDHMVEHLRDDHGLADEEVTAVLALSVEVKTLQRELLDAQVTTMRERLDAGEPVLDERGAALDDPSQAATLREVLDTVDREETAGWLTTALAGLEPTLALVEDVVGSDPLAATTLLALVDGTPSPSRDRSLRANTAWLRSRLLELVVDDHADAEAELRRARELDEGHGPAGFDLVRYLSDRGQAGAALGLLRRIEGPRVEEFTELLRPYAAPGPVSAGRNEPCPCGSGRKYKVCCQKHGGWPLQERLDWVWHKIIGFLASPYAQELVEPIARACGTDAEDGSLRHLAVLNLALFEGGLLEEMCEVRGSLLPADELELLRAWAQVRAGAYELAESADDGTCTVLDLRSGERTTFVDHSVAADLDAGTAALAWLIPEPDGVAPSYGLIVVPDQRRRDLLDLLDEDPSAVELARWYRSLSAGPGVATTAGDAVVFVTRTYEVADGEAARAALADQLEDDGETLVAFEERDGQRWLKGSVEVTADRLTVSTTSVPRALWFGALIDEVLPQATLVDEERRPMADLLADRGDEDAEPGDDELLDLDTLDDDARAEVEAQLEAWMTQHEGAWLDMQLPALDGATPREAAADPTRRDALERLLDEMGERAAGWTGDGRGMDADRIRRLLGL
jgi:hypothetical protein